ncbi:MAG: 4-hydroxyphenylpyruvate dioxygenase [Oligoflexia bacterium]|nr:4-hydroxyphenylpyruvate dioxygenase [Oligoflexia bacterium]
MSFPEMNVDNPAGIEGMAFIEYSSPKPDELRSLFQRLGFSRTAKSKTTALEMYEQNECVFLLNTEKNSFAEKFHNGHGPSICSMGWRVKNAKKAFEHALKNGARPFEGKDGSVSFPAIYGIGDSLIYFIDNKFSFRNSFTPTHEPANPQMGLLKIDHLTHNVPRGDMDKWCDFYAKTFNFQNVRYFDIKGSKTGLLSKVMVSPGYKVIIPINEPSDGKSQIQEYLEEYNGPGIQHVAFLVTNAIHTVEELNKKEISFLDSPPDTYYEVLKTRLPLLWEETKKLQSLSLLADGDEAGYLLQIFTKNMVGPIFYEVIQRENHGGFGNGNFQALFDAIERDQVKRGYLK